jgi:putative spermidine/putrescine transport system ATP-binding protein
MVGGQPREGQRALVAVAPPEGVRAGAEVRLQGLTKLFGAVPAVRDVSMTVPAGSFFTLLGPSGSGKTTTLMMVAGFVQPTRGVIAIDGVDVATLSPQKRDLGMVFQSYAVFPHLTVAQNIAFPLEVRKLGRGDIQRRVGEALALVRLTGYEQRLPRQLSGGEQQRVALARALVFHPRVLLMDEPLGALDKKLRAHMQLELKAIQRQLHVTVIYVTHDQDEALTMSDHVAVMHAGRTEQVGTPAELYESPVSRFVADFVGDSNFLDAVVVSASPDGRTVVRAKGGLELRGTSREPLQAGQRVVAAVRPEKIVTQEARAGDLNRCKGVVEQVVYAGDATRYAVAVGAAGTLTVKLQNRLASRSLAPGDLVELAWDAGDTRVFPQIPDER